MKKIIIPIISAVLIIAGVLLVLWGPLNNYLYQNNQKSKLDDFEKRYDLTEQTTKSENKGYSSNTKSARTGNKKSDKSSGYYEDQEDGHTSHVDLKRLKKDIENYNRSIYESKQPSLGEGSSFDIKLSDYGIEDDIYGYLQIDKIGLCMPIYLGISDYTMSLGATVMKDSSVPYGGNNTNTVIGGHCGYGYADYFRYLENLEKGDIVMITTPFNKLKYKVTDSVVRKPRVTDEYRIQDNKDMVMLFTCHPYPTSKYRLCVICERS